VPALGPRETEPNAWLRWIREGVGLLLRRPWLVAGWSAASLLLFALAHGIGAGPVRVFVFFFLCVLGLTVFIRVAALADESKRKRVSELMPENSHCVLAVGVAAILLALVLGMQGTVESLVSGFRATVEGLGVWQPVDARGLAVAEPLRQLLLGPVLVLGGLLGLALLSVVAVLLLLGQWFLLPMMVLHNPPLPPALVVSAKAYPLNPTPMLGLSGVVLIALAVTMLSLGWVGLLLVPVFGAVMYTSYRDVFLSQADNAPEVYLEMERLPELPAQRRAALRPWPARR
jgi:hypothetical protein